MDRSSFRDLDLWAYQHDVTLDFSRPGKPSDNAFAETFNGKFHAECLNAHWFLARNDLTRDRQQAPDRIDDWLRGKRPTLTQKRGQAQARVSVNAYFSPSSRAK